MRLPRLLSAALAVVLGIALGACGSMDLRKKIDYKSTNKLPPLEVPHEGVEQPRGRHSRGEGVTHPGQRGRPDEHRPGQPA